MENAMRKKVVAVALIGIAFVSIVGFASAQTSKGAGKYQTGVFAKLYGWGAWITIDTTDWTSLISITLPNVPISAYYYVTCDGYAAMHLVDDDLKIAISADSIPVDDDGYSRRFYYCSGVDPAYTGIHTERLYYLGPGRHTFYFLATLYPSASGYASINYQSITVIVFTDGSLIELTATAEAGAPNGA